MPQSVDAMLRDRAHRVIPGGMYGHMSAAQLPAEFPQFLARGEGVHIWDVDGGEYIDLMCGYGPVLLGHRHPHVEAAAQRQALDADTQNMPSPRIVELAEAITARVSHADWAIFSKNGTDATTQCVTIARAATGRRRILVAEGAYHGAAPWCTPRPAGVLPEDRAHLSHYRYNDLESVHAAAADGDLAGIIVSPLRHDLRKDVLPPEPAFTRGLRELCDRTGAVLILDDVRCGLRLHNGGSWEPLGVEPDLSAWSKAIANGYALGAALGRESLRDAAASIYSTGSFWCSAVAMAAALATLEVLEREPIHERIVANGTTIQRGLGEQARAHGLDVVVSGPPALPFLRFVDDDEFALSHVFAATAAQHGVWLHPVHNWFVSPALSEADLEQVLDGTDHAFSEAARQVGDPTTTPRKAGA